MREEYDFKYVLLQNQKHIGKISVTEYSFILFNYRKYEDEKKEELKVVLMRLLRTKIGDAF